eukprot:g14145.t1
MANTATRNMNDSQDDNTNDSQDDNTPAESLTSSLQSDQIMLITKPFQWQGRSASSLNGVSSSLQSSSSHRGARNTKKRTNYMERHHQEVETSIEKFMRVALVLNLFQGSLENPDYTTGNATFKQGSRGTVIEAPSRKDGKLKVKLDNDNEKTFRLIKECDLQLYEGVDFSPNSKFTAGAASSETHDRDHISRNDSIRHTSVQSKTNTKTDKRMENSNDVILQLPPSIDDIEDSENSQLQSSPE